MDEGREGGRNEGNRWSNSTALRHKRESCVWAHPQRSEQVERAQDTERERERAGGGKWKKERERESVSSPEDYFVSHFIHPECWKEQRGRSWVHQELPALALWSFSFLFLNPLLPGFPCAGGQPDFCLQEKTHSGKTEIETPTRREGKWENCSKSQCLRRKRSSEKLQKVRILIHSSLFQIV